MWFLGEQIPISYCLAVMLFDSMNNKKAPCKNILTESKILGQHSHIRLPLVLIRKSENMTLLCSIDSMEEFEVLRRTKQCEVEKEACIDKAWLWKICPVFVQIQQNGEIHEADIGPMPFQNAAYAGQWAKWEDPCLRRRLDFGFWFIALFKY